eukprot:2293_1
MADRIAQNVEQLMILSKEYDPQVSFKYENKLLTQKEIINHINTEIKSILDSVIDDYLDLDIAFVEIHKLIMFAVDKINDNNDSFHFISYHKFLIHFIIFGCCLSSNYRKYMVLNRNKDKHYRKSQLLRYCIDEFLPKVTTKHIKYAQCNTYSNSIKDSLLQNVDDMNANVATLITDFVQFKFDEFFQTLSIFFKTWQTTHGNKTFNTNFSELWSFYGFSPTQIHYDAFLPRLLYSKQFISMNRNDNYKLYDDLEFFGDGILLSINGKHSLKSNSKNASTVICYAVLIMCFIQVTMSVSIIFYFFFKENVV